MAKYALRFNEIDKTMIQTVGGKGANLGELSRVEGIRVPDGFCVTTEAYKDLVAGRPDVSALTGELASLTTADPESVGALSQKIRGVIEAIEIPEEIGEEILRLLRETGEDAPYAVRSSATAEDLPSASFAGQQDTYLNIIGAGSVLAHIRKCWASLFTDRAVIYRMQNGFEHGKVLLSIVVQKMVFPDAAGIMFTADPVSSDRKTASIDAGFGLGEALVSGMVDADIYKVRNGAITGKKVSRKKLAVYALEAGGTEEREIPAGEQNRQALSDGEILRLAETGKRIEAHYGAPQDIEWCLCGGDFYIVQSRPITTLYPAPAPGDDKNHVYMSMGHQQMMTEPITPLGASVFQLFLRNLTSQPILEAGGRMYLDVSRDIASPLSRKIFIESGLGSVEGLIQKALKNITARRDFMRGLAKGKGGTGLTGGSVGDMARGVVQAIKIYRENDAGYIPKTIERVGERLEDTRRRIAAESGAGLLDFIKQDFAGCYKMLVLDNYGSGILGAMTPAWVNKNIKKWLGEENVADFLSQSIVCNVTTEMGLALLDVADAVRGYPEVLEYLQDLPGNDFYEGLAPLPGGAEAAEAFRAYLNEYGARCTGEIDIARTRWAEDPRMIASMVLNNVHNFPPGSRNAIVEEKRRAVDAKVEELVSRITQLPGGRAKAKKIAKQISVMRNFAGLREYPKFAMIQHFLVYKEALLREAGRFAREGAVRDPADIFFLHFDELREAFSSGSFDSAVIAGRRSDYALYAKLTPPRVMTSDGEIIAGEYDTGSIPEGALCGVPVSAGAVEGTARVVLKLEEARVGDDDILVTAFTDPSWTAVFVSIKGLVTEVGGMMTHGAVVAREYGIPAVVSVENATTLIKDGQRIRVDGAKGYVEILE